jgi:transposase
MPRGTRRTFTPQFKAQVVLQLLTGQHSHAELCRQHQLSPSLLSLWKDTCLERLPLLFQDDARLDQQQARVAELEQLVGRQALELEILKKASRLLPGNADRNGRWS